MSMIKFGVSILAVSSLMLTSSEMIFAQDQEPFVPKPALPSQLQKKESTVESESPESELEDNDQENTQDSEPTTRENDSKEESTSEKSTKKEDKNQAPKGLLDGDIVVYPNNVFESKENLKDFVEYLQTNDHTKNQFNVETDEENLLLAVTYTKDAKDDKQPIVFYGETSFDSKDKAQHFIDDALLMYPDLFFQGEPVESEDVYHIALGIRRHVNSQAVWYDQDRQLIKYTDKRKPYTYVVKKGQEDKYKPAIEAAFPDIFEFKEEETSDGKKVTMKQVQVSRESQQNNLGRSFIKIPKQIQPIVNVLNTAGDTIYKWLSQIGLSHYLDGFNVVGENAWVLTLVSICVVLAILLIVIELFK